MIESLAAVSSLVRVIQTHVPGEPADCERCPHQGPIGVYWIPRGEQCGYLRVCPCCVVDAVEIALDDAPDDSVITVELELYKPLPPLPQPRPAPDLLQRTA